MSFETSFDGKLIGQVTGGYRILSPIGSGTMGHVYEAEDVGNGRRVALKVLHRRQQKELAARFQREGKTLALLSHPNIVQLVDMGQLDDGALFLATELIGGGSLRALMDGGALEPRRALLIVRQLLGALDAAHALGVVHRDIKPENVMVGERDVVKVLDFGVAKLLADTIAGLGEANLTSIGFSIFGSALYIAPESVTGEAVDARIDIYSTGAMLFEMVAGRPPFNDPDPAVILRQHAFEAPPTLQQAVPAMTFDPALEALVARALAKRPDDRFRTAEDMIAAVDAVIQSLDRGADKQHAERLARAAIAAAPPVVTGVNVASAVDRRARTEVVRLSSRKKRLIAGGGAAAAALVAVLWFTSRDGPGAPPSGTLAARANGLVRAGSGREAVELLQRELKGRPTPDQAAAYLELGHAQFALGQRQQGLGAYERALRALPSIGSDKTLHTNLAAVLDGNESLASILALDLMAQLTPPQLDAIVSYASAGKLVDARRRAIMIAEREGVAERVDLVQSWALDLQQAAGCDERKTAIGQLAATSDRRALAPLKRIRAVKCVEREAAEAIARIESVPARN